MAREEGSTIISLVLRYVIIILAGFGNLHLFYSLLTPLTTKTLYGILSVFSDKAWSLDTFIYFNGTLIEIIPACVAGAAFYLLFILVMSTADISVRKRLSVLLASFVALFVFNILRLVFLVTIIGISYFETIHWVFWNLVSTVAVVGIWFYLVKRFAITSIPVYSDVLYLLSLAKPKTVKRASSRTKQRKKAQRRK